MYNYLIVDGKKIPSEDARISALDAGFIYGFAVYETFFVKDSRIPFFQEHMERMAKSIDFFKFPVEKSFYEDIKVQAKDLINSNQISQGRMRLTISPGNWVLPELKSEKITTVLSVSPISKSPMAVKLMTSRVRKTNDVFLPSFVKVTGNFPSLLSYREARANGFDEAVMLRQDGIVTEGSFCNLFWLDLYGRFKTPSLDCCILDGVTRNQIIESARSIGIEVIEGRYSEDELATCNSLFISSSTRGLLKASQLDERIFSTSEIESILEIQKEYEMRENESLKSF